MSNEQKQEIMTTIKNKTIFILDTFTNEVLSSMIIKCDSDIPFSFKCEFEILKDNLGTVVAKEWIEGEEKAKRILN
jgi:hypothetical protein